MGEFHSRLKELRTECGLSQQKLAEKLLLTQTAIYKYECGKSEPCYEILIRIACFFQVSIDYLLGNSDVRRADDNHSCGLAPDELILLQRYKALSVRQREGLIALLNDRM